MAVTSTQLTNLRVNAYCATDVFTATGNGQLRGPLLEAPVDHAIQVTTTGSPSTISVTVQGSLDGANWSTLGSAITATGLTFIADSPVLFLRAVLGTLTGGTSPTVTVTVLSAGFSA